jgi:hypothetical protein
MVIFMQYEVSFPVLYSAGEYDKPIKPTLNIIVGGNLISENVVTLEIHKQTTKYTDYNQMPYA